ncbi:MAG: alanine--tRNA ligase [Sphingomonadaceae bacterium]|nr:alanine--tRNA ligase [Sphingomonadaceae bacterium]
MISSNDIRRSFLEHFAAHGHTVVPSAPLVPLGDPSLMFVNAGMVPFKNVFTGLESRPYSTAASSQKCVRAGGKHNDLDNVGYTARHLTFLEMLGNFSFGDYFKEQAITLAWDLVTRGWGLPKDRLSVTVYHTDDQAWALWKRIAGLPDERIIRIATKDNFWAMGADGPCGPCSEIFYDYGPGVAGGPPGSPDEDGDRFVEIWNLVFMQYLQQADQIVGDLPRPSIDTGMGLERAAAVLQGVQSVFDTDIFRLLTDQSVALTGRAVHSGAAASHRVIADHLRSSAMLIADGVLPSNEGRGYVLRRIMRRAMRHAQLLGAREPLMWRLVPALSGAMGSAYPDLVRAQPLIEETLKLEETRFRQTLDRGLKLLDEATAGLTAGDTLPGAVAFKLYDTYGFPYDLTEDALRGQGLRVDRAGFDVAMAEQKRAARAAWTGSGDSKDAAIWFDLVDRTGATEFVGYTADHATARVVALVTDGREVAAATGEVTVLVNQTPFYAESGGQVGDAGVILGDRFRAEVTDTTKALGRLFLHHARVEGEVRVGDEVRLEIDTARRAAVRANHSATHLLHAALRHRLGGHVTQKGSLVAPDRLRFDFSHPRALSADDLAAVEAEVNRHIRDNDMVTTRLMTPDQAIAEGAMALFGEKYGDEVRVLSMGRASRGPGRDGGMLATSGAPGESAGPAVGLTAAAGGGSQSDGEAGAWSVELCGGTHVRALGDIALFKIVSETAVSAGVRRIEALTGEAARRWLLARDAALSAAAAELRTRPEDVPARVAALVDTARRLERELAEARRALALGGGAAGDNGPAPEAIAGTAFLGQVVEGLDPKALRGVIDDAKKRLGSGVAAVVAVNDGRASIAVGITDDLAGRLSAVDLVRAGVAALGGQGGGGRPDMAQGGGPDGAKAADAIASVRQALAASAVAA